MSEYRIYRVIRYPDGTFRDIEYIQDLVRCKDCRWAYPRKLKGETGVNCVFHGVLKADNGYCEIGERKDNE